MNKDELIRQIAKKTKISQKQVSLILATTLEVIQKAVAKKKRVTLSDFGTFQPRVRAARIFKSPKTGKNINVPSKAVPVFTAGKKFRALVNKSK